MSMGLVLFLLMAALEISLVVYSCNKAAERKVWRKNRLFVRIAETVIAVSAILLPFGQRWRLFPVLGLLVILTLIPVILILAKRGREEKEKKKAGIIGSCIMSIFLIGFSLVPAMIFTGYKGLPTSGEYPVRETSAILVDHSRTDPFEQDGSFREVPVHFYYPKTAEDNTERFPLVIFSHGAFGYYQSNTSTYMELASNGYVVAALDHPHHAFFTKDTDGKTVIADMGFMNAAINLNDDVPAEEQFALYTEWMALRTSDMNFVLDKTEAACRGGAVDESWFISGKEYDAVQTVLHITDISRIGVMGHSMGGAAAVELGRERNDISAVVDIDGTMLSEYTGVADGELTVREEAYVCPVLEFNNWKSYHERMAYLEQGGIYPNDVLIQNASEGYAVTIRDTEHMDFTDLPLLSPFLGNMLGSGERDKAETMTVVNSLVLQFFDHYLKGSGVFSVQEIY